MADKKRSLRAFAQRMQLGEDTLIKIPLLELAADKRVLIENYGSICKYSAEAVQIHVDFGCITVNGDSLELAQMDRERLVICGRIREIRLDREESV